MNSPIVCYALRGLQSCWMPDRQAFCHAFRPDLPRPHVSIPASDVFYTLNVLLGLSRVRDREAVPWDLGQLFRTSCDRLQGLPVPTYAYGMAMWAGGELELEIPEQTMRTIEGLLADRSAWIEWSAQDVGIMLSGVIAQSGAGRTVWEGRAHALMEHLKENHAGSPSGLFYESPARFRRRFASFATGTYLTLACFQYGERFGDQEAINIALRCAGALRQKQGPRGEWPWFYDVRSGRILDWYQVYAVHQDGMAPAFLHHADKHGDIDAREAVRRGFFWVLGENELGASMLVPEHGIILRSHMRIEGRQRERRALRAVINWAMGRASSPLGPDRVTVDRECRSYHLGWILWSFGARDDYRELTHHTAFAETPATAGALR